MDMWSVGCIFGELLQRMERPGASITPNLSIMPVFQFSNWSPPTPGPGCFIRDGVLAGKVRAHEARLHACARLQPRRRRPRAHTQELEAIFDVIGSPEWSCIEAVESEAWRSFLWQVPATAPHLMRRFGFAGEPAVDLLRRMLAFDPNRRCAEAPLRRMHAACARVLAATSTCLPARHSWH
jgi:mitogen-activated protein kinase 1/3